MVDYFIAITFILLALYGWVLVQNITRRFSERHPEFGSHREEGGGCGKSCMCGNKQCANRQAAQEKSFTQESTS